MICAPENHAILPDELSRWQGDQPGDRPHLHRWMNRVWPPRGWWCCCGCACCDTTNACATTRFSDCFNSALAGYTDTGCGITSVSFSASGGFLTETFGSGATPKYSTGGGTRTQAITIPALNGLCISVSAKIYAVTGKFNGTTGVCIGKIGSMFGRFTQNLPRPTTAYAAWNSATAAGCVDALGTFHTFGTANANFTDGDCLCLVLKDTSSGGGTYSLKSYVNGTLLDTYSGVAYTLTAGGTLNVGVLDTNGGKWSNLCIATS